MIVLVIKLSPCGQAHKEAFIKEIGLDYVTNRDYLKPDARVGENGCLFNLLALPQECHGVIFMHAKKLVPFLKAVEIDLGFDYEPASNRFLVMNEHLGDVMEMAFHDKQCFFNEKPFLRRRWAILSIDAAGLKRMPVAFGKQLASIKLKVGGRRPGCER